MLTTLETPAVPASPSRRRASAMQQPQSSADAARPTLQVRFLSEHAQLPSRGSAGAAGYDLYSAHDTVIPARGRAVVRTDISICVPEGTYARIAPRSGLAVKNGLMTGAGVVDVDYRGPVGVVLFNHSDEEFVVHVGDRIAQMILERIATPEVVRVDELDDTARGTGGFGSTGVSSLRRGKPAE
jgi:dUTP pyrophosphatase